MSNDYFFDRAIAYVLKNEGDGYTNDPKDAGGPTRFGITLGTLSCVKVNAAAADVESLTEDEARAVYQKLFWEPLQCGALMDSVAVTMLLDAAVLCGKKSAVEFLQHAYRQKIDGTIGPKTIAAVNINANANGSAYRLFFGAYQVHLAHAVCINGDNSVFLQGWLARTRRLLALMFPQSVDKGADATHYKEA